MKKSKILVPALAVLALGIAGATTGTVAWFQVTANGAVKTSSNSADITAVKPSGNVTVELPLTVGLSTSPTNLELAHWFKGDDLLAADEWSKGTPAGYTVQESAMTEGLYTAVHLSNADKTLIYNNAAMTSGNALFADITITITAPSEGATIDGVPYTKAEIATLLNNKTVDIALARDENSRAMFFSLGASAVTAAAEGATSKSVSNITLSNLATTGVVYHFGIYVEGVNGDTIDTAVAGDYVVTVSAHA